MYIGAKNDFQHLKSSLSWRETEHKHNRCKGPTEHPLAENKSTTSSSADLLNMLDPLWEWIVKCFSYSGLWQNHSPLTFQWTTAGPLIKRSNTTEKIKCLGENNGREPKSLNCWFAYILLKCSRLVCESRPTCCRKISIWNSGGVFDCLCGCNCLKAPGWAVVQYF